MPRRGYLNPLATVRRMFDRQRRDHLRTHRETDDAGTVTTSRLSREQGRARARRPVGKVRDVIAPSRYGEAPVLGKPRRATARPPHVVKAERRAANRRARTSRKANRR